jgi:hypothetical protein
MIVSARWMLGRFGVPRRLGTTITTGLIAIGLLLPAEIAPPKGPTVFVSASAVLCEIAFSGSAITCGVIRVKGDRAASKILAAAPILEW